MWASALSPTELSSTISQSSNGPASTGMSRAAPPQPRSSSTFPPASKRRQPGQSFYDPVCVWPYCLLFFLLLYCGNGIFFFSEALGDKLSFFFLPPSRFLFFSLHNTPSDEVVEKAFPAYLQLFLCLFSHSWPPALRSSAIATSSSCHSTRPLTSPATTSNRSSTTFTATIRRDTFPHSQRPQCRRRRLLYKCRPLPRTCPCRALRQLVNSTMVCYLIFFLHCFLFFFFFVGGWE